MKTTSGMKLLFGVALGLGLGLTSGGCNSGLGDCPGAASVQPGAACDDDHLQCPYDLSTPSLACDGTTTVIASSCVCDHGSWHCPDPVSCEAGAPAPDTDAGGDAAAD